MITKTDVINTLHETAALVSSHTSLRSPRPNCCATKAEVPEASAKAGI
ncbi:hypothetical protein C4K18_3045 [Pseudomonas chlororaphis subsp. aurantiaca]|nr:hypothetical protein C4K18_3045 [Pseudomonas chlororaphis subsp. aurantiaca]